MKLENSLVKILIVDDELEYREVLEMILSDKGYTTDTAASAEDALVKIKDNEYHIVLTDLMMGEMDGIDLLKEIKEKQKDVEVILITGHGTINNAVEAMKMGAYTYFIKGHKSEELLKEVKKIESKILLKIGNKMLDESSNDSNFMLKTNNKHFKKILDIAKKAARSSVNILILGESGVGKEVFASHIHNASNRNEKPFIPVNCSSFSDNLLESELFGHEKGSFTGATTKRHGRFEKSHEGTLFLDEIGDISLSTQVKLLRTIETKNVQRIGSNDSIKVDFRLITATNKNLQNEIAAGNFREDFFYRISTITIEIPPLRERKEDLEMLIDFFLQKSKKSMNKEIDKIENGVMDFLLSYDYPGNVRELKNIMDRLVVLSEGGIIREKDLPICREVGFTETNTVDLDEDKDILRMKKSKMIKPLKDVRKEIEAEYIEKVLLICENNISEAARKLCISRRQLFNKICEYGLKDEK
jgi:DNA-binding NtrC family response regulator